MAVLEDGSFAPSFTFNPVLHQLADRLRRRGMRDFWRETERINQLVTSTLDISVALTYLEAMSAAEVHVYDGYSFSNVARRALVRAIELGAAYGVPTLTLADEFISRGFWGWDGSEFGRPDYGRPASARGYFEWHKRHRGSYASMLRTAGQWPEGSPLEIRAAVQKQLQDPRPGALSYAQDVFLKAYVLLGQPTEFTLTNLRMVRIGNAAELEYALDGMAAIAEGSIKPARGEKLIEQALQMIGSLIVYCAEQGIENAQKIQALIAENYRRTRHPLQIATLVSLARGLQAKSGGAIHGSELNLELPGAVDTIVDAIVNLGHNALTVEERQVLIGYGQLASDVFVLGRYAQDQVKQSELTVGDFLAANPQLSAKRLERVLNPRGRRKASGPAVELARTFGSVVYYDLWAPGRGLAT